ncbi:nucleoside hydrolase-like domain-containing protein [Cyclobacterium marinum]|uniref:Uncharacterized protein n=1 Tax=Cyclobacterium marinum (strain ATCC 25205 / DSM 745 / LMG 13164 / NCIMB 1802) TaxID=880070 RepID=G0J2P4_CYCMS|nr:nucleoside hydrolase-like domain-containing protein [Cyclobacterium marinum]AEL26627.1 protein of unknown function DUF1593 [Cyclobacterium marinum DSM 745]
MKFKLRVTLLGLAVLILMSKCKSMEIDTVKPRVLISSDIGGTDPDDFQSMIHLLMYADQFEIEGLVASPFGDGRKSNFLDIIDDYEKDYAQLAKHASDLPKPAALRAVVKQGAIPAAPFKGYSTSTEGSDWIIKCAKKESDQPLWVLVWGGIEDLAQALHDAPEIKENIRVYWIGGPNKKWSINAYSYIAANHGDLWMIEANATYRGWFMDEDSPEAFKAETYYDNFIQGRGVMGKDFINYYKGEIKMGDTPSLAYVMNGDPEDPTGESWGGSFEKIDRSSRSVFEGGSTNADTVAAYAIIEWRFKGPKITVPEDSAVFQIKIQGQIWPGYYLGEGIYGVKYSSKKAEHGKYKTSSEIPELNGLEGEYISTIPWPGKPSSDDFQLGSNWYSDRLAEGLFIKDQQGAKTISKHREAFLGDWGERWKWLEK